MNAPSTERSGLPVRVDYERLLVEYEKGLVDTLRGFGVAAEYLESWVPDEDPVKSLCNMVEAANTYGQDAISVFIGKATAADLEPAALLAAVCELGEVRIEREADGLVLEVTRIAEWAERADAGRTDRRGPISSAEASSAEAAALAATAAPNETTPAPSPPAAAREAAEAGDLTAIGPCYRATVQERLDRIDHEGDLPRVAGTVPVEGSLGSTTLSLRVDPETHTIRRAVHRGATGPVARALLDQLCELIEGLPIQEASDHGVIRLEADLRDGSEQPPVPGIITPESAEPALALPLELVRDALRAYRERIGYQETANEFDPGPSPEWRSLGDADRRARLDRALADICRENGFAPEGVAVTAIEHDVRIVVDLTGELALGDKQSHMMTLEAGLKDMVDCRIELFLEELTDENKIRRLSQAGKPI